MAIYIWIDKNCDHLWENLYDISIHSMGWKIARFLIRVSSTKLLEKALEKEMTGTSGKVICKPLLE